MNVSDRAACIALDRSDPLGPLRERFALPPGLIYLDGNSLGPPATGSADRARAFVEEEWGPHLVGGWNVDGWLDLPLRLGARVAPLVGAHPDEVVVCDSTSVNLYKLLHAACALRPDRRVIVAADDDFPTDRYLVDAVATQRGCSVRWVDPAVLSPADLAAAAVFVCSHVHYRTARLHDMAGLTARCHAAGALALWDVSHSVGALPVALDACAVDLAVGCTYKFLNGGPGAPAFAYVARAHHDALANPIAGWLGHAAPFAFESAYRPSPGVGRLVAGTPSVLAFAALGAALDAFTGVDLSACAHKSARLSTVFTARIAAALGDELTGVSPTDPNERGSHVALRHAAGYPIVQALIDRGVICDFREPDVLRFGFAPLYLRYVDAFDAAEILIDVMRSGAWRAPRFAERAAVT